MFCQFWQFFDRRKCRKNVEGKCPKIQAKKKLGQKLSQKLQQIPSKNRFKIQNNNPKNGAARGARRPIFGASARGASVVVLKFVSIFCWTWLGFLAGFLPLIFWDRFLDRFFEQFFVFFQTFFKSLLAETFFGKTDFGIDRAGRNKKHRGVPVVFLI